MNLLLPSERAARILVTRADRIGDLVLSTPVFSALKRRFPGSKIACLTFCENREIVEGNPSIDEVILYDKKGSERGVWGNWRFARRLARKRFDAVIHLHATNRMHWVGWLAGIPVRIGYDRKCRWALTHAYPDRKKEGKKHEAQYNFDLLEILEVERPARLEFFFPVSRASEASLEFLLRRLEARFDLPWIVFNPSASCPSKKWPAERFGDLARQIGENQEAVFFAIGTRADRRLIERMKERMPQPLIDLSGRLTLGMLGGLLKRAKLLISNDSGPVHIAAALKTPVLSIFGRKQDGLSPRRWGPVAESSAVLWKDVGCEVCLAHRCEIQFLCLDAISVEEALIQVNGLLGKSFDKAAVS